MEARLAHKVGEGFFFVCMTWTRSASLIQATNPHP